MPSLSESKFSKRKMVFDPYEEWVFRYRSTYLAIYRWSNSLSSNTGWDSTPVPAERSE